MKTILGLIISNLRGYLVGRLKFIFPVAFYFIHADFSFSQKIDIVNPGFEERDSVAGRFIKGWLPGTDVSEIFIPAGTDFTSQSVKDTKADLNMLIADSIPHTGTFCLSLKMGESVLQTLSHQIFQGKQYTLTFYARSRSLSAKLNAKLYFLGGYGREKLAAYDIELSAQYQLFTLKYTAIVPESYGYYIGIQFENLSGDGQTVFVDDVSLEEGNNGISFIDVSGCQGFFESYAYTVALQNTLTRRLSHFNTLSYEK